MEHFAFIAMRKSHDNEQQKTNQQAQHVCNPRARGRQSARGQVAVPKGRIADRR